MVSYFRLAQFSHLTFEECHFELCQFVACLVFLGMAFSFIKSISSSDTLTKREAAILKICPPAIITSPEVIIAEYDAILGQ